MDPFALSVGCREFVPVIYPPGGRAASVSELAAVVERWLLYYTSGERRADWFDSDTGRMRAPGDLAMRAALNALKSMGPGAKAEQLRLRESALRGDREDTVLGLLRSPNYWYQNTWVWIVIYVVRVKLSAEALAMLRASGCADSLQLLGLVDRVYSGYTSKSLKERDAHRSGTSSRAGSAQATSNRTVNTMYALLKKFGLNRKGTDKDYEYEHLFGSCHLVPFKMHMVLEDIMLLENAVRYLLSLLKEPLLGCCPSCYEDPCVACLYCGDGLHDQRIEWLGAGSVITTYIDVSLPKDIKHRLIELLEVRQRRMQEWRAHLQEFSVGHAGRVLRGHTKASDGTTGSLLTAGAEDLQLSLYWPVAAEFDEFSSMLECLVIERDLYV